MIIKEYLIEQGVDLQRFQQFRKRPAKARRKLNRTYGGEKTVPTPRTTTQIKETLKVCYIVELETHDDEQHHFDWIIGCSCKVKVL